MSSPIGPNEIRVVIQLVEARDYDVGPIPAQLFKKTFDGFFTALETTDRELQPKARSSEFVISHLALNSCEFGITEKRRSFGQNSALRPSSSSDAAPRASTEAITKPLFAIHG